jgi:lipopolysaccharide biosynthesis glycosyltransferase
MSNTRESCVVDAKPCAFVTLLMKNPHYVFGGMVMGYSLRLTNTKHLITCMITEDLYDDYHELLETVFDKVFSIPYITQTIDKLCSKKQDEIYGEWKNVSFTKWQCLALTEYEKICFLDADLIIVKNIDHLFDLKTPAACFKNFWSDFGRSGSTTNYYEGIKYGDEIKESCIRRGLSDGYVLVAHCVVLTPSIDAYNGFIKYMKCGYKQFTKCISMVDETSITDYMLQTGQKWTQLDYIYNTIPWHINKTNVEYDPEFKTTKFKPPKILHYFNKEKPWIMNRGKWEDIEIWWQYYDDMKKNIPTTKFNDIFAKLEKFNAKTKPFCPYCKFVNRVPGVRYTKFNHMMIVNGNITCTNLIN